MPRIFVAPADHSGDRTLIDRSIANPVERQVIIQSFSDATYPELIDIERRGRGFFAWGLPAEPGNVEHWFHMGVGDFVLIYYDGAFRHYGKVLGRYENSRAAAAIWGAKEDADVSRELLFFLSEPIALSLPTEQLNDYIDDKSEEIPAGFRRNAGTHRIGLRHDREILPAPVAEYRGRRPDTRHEWHHPLVRT